MTTSKSFNVSKYFSENSAIDNIITGVQPVGIQTYNTVDDLPLSGVTTGSQAYVNSNNRLYMWTGAGWFSIALINQNPSFDSDGIPDENYVLDSSNGSPTIIQLSATDPEQIPIQYSYIAGDSADLLADITQDSSVFSFISKSQPQLDSNGYTTGGTFNVSFKASDGVNIASQNSLFVVLGTPYTSLTQMYNSGIPDGIYPISIPNVGIVSLRYSSYNNKGWVEVLFSSNSNFDTAVNNWVSGTNSGWNGTLGDGTRYYLKNYNNSAENNGLDYTQTDSIKLLGPGFNATDIAITSKSSVNGNGIIATGANQDSVLPLTIADLSGTDVPSTVTALLNYFKGTGPGFQSTTEYGVGWVKAGKGEFDISLNYRDGSLDVDEWHIADGNPGSSTWYSNIGYRSGSYGSANVGSWSEGTGSKNSVYRIDESNVLSIWLTDM